MQSSGLNENLQKYMPWVILVVFAVFFTWHALGPMPAHDHFWHLATARDFVKLGLSPFVDHFSYTYSGEPISISVLPYQLGIYAFTEMFGLVRGYQIVFVLCLLMLWVLMWGYFRYKSIPWWLQLFGACVLFSSVTQRYLLRPETPAFAIFLLLLFWCFRVRKDFSWKNILWLAFFQLLFVNYGPISALGYLIIGALYFEKCFDLLLAQTRDKKVWIQVLSGGLITLLVGWLNPTLHHPLFFVLSIDRAWDAFILEHQQVLFRQQPWQVRMLLAMMVVGIVVSLRKREWMPALVFGLLGYRAASGMRLGPFLVIFALPFFVVWIREFFDSGQFSKFNTSARTIVVTFFSVSIIGMLYSILIVLMQFPVQHGFPPHIYSEKFVQDMRKDDKVRGKVWNMYGIGGMITWAFGDKVKVVIDGRTNILYPIQHMENFQAMQFSAMALVNHQRKYDVNWAMTNAVLPTLFSAGAVLYWNARAFSTYSFKEQRYPLGTTFLTFPECWPSRPSDAITRQVRNELNQARKTAPAEDSELTGVLELTNIFISNKKEEEWSEQLKGFKYYSEAVHRYASVVKSEAGLNKEALEDLSYIRVKRISDILLEALIVSEQGELEKADKLAGAVLRDIGILTPISSKYILKILDNLKPPYEIKYLTNDLLNSSTKIKSKKETSPLLIPDCHYVDRYQNG